MWISKNEDGTVAVGNVDNGNGAVEVQSLPDSQDVLLWNDAEPTAPIVDVGLVTKREREAFKAERQKLVDNIEVTYNALIFQGDEISQDRMSRAINALPDDVSTILWVAKDNTATQLNKIDLRAILFDAGNQQASIWIP